MSLPWNQIAGRVCLGGQRQLLQAFHLTVDVPLSASSVPFRTSRGHAEASIPENVSIVPTSQHVRMHLNLIYDRPDPSNLKNTFGFGNVKVR
jgi:hypothetical protein